MTIGFSNQAVGLKKGKKVKTYVFSKKEFDPGKVPPYAYDLEEKDDEVSFKCAFGSDGTPIMKK